MQTVIKNFQQLLNLRIETYALLKRNLNDPIAVEWADDCLNALMEVKKDLNKCMTD